MSEDSALRKDVSKELAQAFFALLLHHRSYFQGMLAELSISAPQFHVLHFLFGVDGSLSMRDLSLRSGCEPSHLTGIVDKLEERKLVRRKVDPQDRRSKLVSLTKSGRSFRDKLMARLSEPVPWMNALVWEDQAMLLLLIKRALAQTEAKK
ncbi:MAG TPA: MarR family transcriptional regulator [Pseudomonadota bacterium]|jgi:DNA-binding MarR family transcriptional regulator|nr:MarR family transcriptional regulator [Pseudomonadota bacterium]